MINRSPSPIKSQSGTNSISESSQQPNLSKEVQYFEQIPDNQPKSVYSNQGEIDQGLPGYAEKAKSGYSNNDAISGYGNVNESNQLSQPAVAQVGDSTQSLQNLIISIKDDQTGNIKSAYKVCPILSQEETTLIEQQCGVVLKKDTVNPGIFNGFLGGGAFGKVYVAREENLNPAKYVAIKIVQGNQRALVESKHESGLQLKLTQAVNAEDSQLMPIIGIGENLSRAQNEAEKLYIVMPLAGMGSGEGLRKDLNELKQANKSPEFYRLLNLHIAKSMLIGLHQMHRNHIYHLDLKPANMMITRDGRIQLSDFGTSEEVPGNPPSLKVGRDQQSGRFIGNGDSSYFPQERTFYEGSVFNPAKADIYAVGLVLWEFLTGKEFDGFDPLSNPIFNNVVKGSLEELTLRLLNPQAVSRISLEDALNYPCLTAAEAHDEGVNRVVLSFLSNYVKYAQSKAKGGVKVLGQLSQNLKADLAKSQFQVENTSESQVGVATNHNDNPDKVYLQPFQASQIDTYVANYIAQHKETIKEQVEQKQLPPQWLEAKYVQEQINSIPGLKELMQTPLLSRLVLIALPELNKQQNQAPTTSCKITRAQVYEAFMRQWIITQIRKNNTANPNAKPKAVEISDTEINQIIAFGEKMALTMYRDNRTAQLTVGLQSFSFKPNTGKYQVNPSRYQWFEQGKVEQTLLPLQEVQNGAYKFIHLSMQEYLLARHLINELSRANTLIDLTLNQVILTMEEKDRPILYFMGDMATMSKVVADKLFTLINQTKMIKSQGIAGANAISVLNVSEVSLTGQDFSNTYLPNSDLSGSVLWHTNFSNANLPNINLQGSKLNNSNFTKANLAGLRLGQYPMYHLKESINALCYSPDGCYLAISQENELILFDAVTRKEIRRFKGHIYWIDSVSFSGDGKRVVTAVAYDKTARIYDVESGECLKVLEGHTVWSVSFSGDGKKVATGSNDNLARIYDADSGDCLKVLDGHISCITSVSFSGDGKQLVTGSNDNVARIYDADSGDCLKVLVGHTGDIRSVSFSADGKKVVTGSDDFTARIYDAGSGECLNVLVGSTKEIWNVSFSVDGKLVATGSYDGTARIYDVVSGDCLKVLVGHTKAIYNVSFSVDGKRVATGSSDKTARIYDAVSGDCLKVLAGHTDWIESVSFSVDGKRVATGSWDKTVRIYDSESGECLKVLEGHTRAINSVIFSVDGTMLLTDDYSYRKKMWSVSSGKALKFDDTFTVWNGSSTRLLDKLSVEHEGKIVNLKQNFLLPGLSSSNTEELSLRFPSGVKDVSLSKSITGNEIILTVGFETGIAFYSKALESPLSEFRPFKVSMIDQGLDGSGMNLSNTKGLSESNYEVLQQLGAVGEAVKPADPSQLLESELQAKDSEKMRGLQ